MSQIFTESEIIWIIKLCFCETNSALNPSIQIFAFFLVLGICFVKRVWLRIFHGITYSWLRVQVRSILNLIGISFFLASFVANENANSNQNNKNNGSKDNERINLQILLSIVIIARVNIGVFRFWINAEAIFIAAFLHARKVLATHLYFISIWNLDEIKP